MEKRLNHLKEKLVYAVEGQLANIDAADTKELGEVIDMIKDLEEAVYYCTITKSMEEASKEKKERPEVYYYSEKYLPMEPYMPYPQRNMPPYGRDMDKSMGRIYYDGGNGDGGKTTLDRRQDILLHRSRTMAVDRVGVEISADFGTH